MNTNDGGRTERRLAAVLAADVAGYSRLMEADEEGTLVALKATRRELCDPKIVEHRGRIVKTTGDGLLVEFGSVVDAVRCAVDVQSAMAQRNEAVPAERRLEFRIGIHQGDIIVEDGDIFGEGVNLAARLEGLAEPGGICVSGRVRSDVVGKVDVAFEDFGERQVKNLTRPVHVWRIGPQAPRPPALLLPDKPSLAVLPFQNMSGDPEQEYFADGIVEEITTAIARMPWLFVIARNSAFTYKGRAVDVKQVARELGVRYVLEGSVRKAGNRVRITGQLIDTATSAHIWADRFDGALDDIFELQDQVASSVAGAIEPKLRQSEIDRASRKPTESLDAYDHYLRGLRDFYKVTFEGNREALRLFERALALDPSCAPAAAMAASSWAARKYHNWAPVSDGEVAEAVGLATTAIDFGKDDPDSLSRAAWALGFFIGDVVSALHAVDRAVVLNPNLAYAWNTRGWVLVWMEQPEQAAECFERAMRLSPLDPMLWAWLYGMARCHFVMGRLDEALRWADKALLEQPRAVNVTVFKTGVCGQLGLADEARTCLQRLRELSPGFSVGTFATQVVPRGVSARIAALWAEGLRRAGVPEA
jgi:TolB-like protein/class 3 adenylate cyclase